MARLSPATVRMSTTAAIRGAKLNPLQPREKPGNQGAMHFSILADPNNPNLVYIGGDRQDNPAGFPNSIGADDFTGRLFRGDTTVPAVAPGDPTNEFSPQWDHLTHTQNAGFAGGGTPGTALPMRTPATWRLTRWGG